MTDTGKYRTISFCVSEEFDAVEVMFAKIQDEYNLSRAEIFRVIMHDFLELLIKYRYFFVSIFHQ